MKKVSENKLREILDSIRRFRSGAHRDWPKTEWRPDKVCVFVDEISRLRAEVKDLVQDPHFDHRVPGAIFGYKDEDVTFREMHFLAEYLEDYIMRLLESPKAKVFISCGQKKGTEETRIAKAIAEVLVGEGFEAYIAVDEQTLSGLKENIFSHLTSAEYFLFIDFRREQLDSSGEHRGSLFSHQELAIASYLELPIIAFQQEGVKTLDGMLPAFQVNPIPFDNVNLLPTMVRDQVIKAGWRANWKNTLRITRDPLESSDAHIINLHGQPLARYFHLNVENLNPYKLAVNCIAYVAAIRDLRTCTSLPFQTAELKWAGYTFPNAAILPGSSRQVDAFFVLHNSPQTLHFSCFTDSGYFMGPIQGPG